MENEKNEKCEGCESIDDLEIDYPEDPWHGGIRYCGLCEAEYYEEYGGKTYATNEDAKINHPELEIL